MKTEKDGLPEESSKNNRDVKIDIKRSGSYKCHCIMVKVYIETE